MAARLSDLLASVRHGVGAITQASEQIAEDADERQRLVQTQLALICRQLAPLRTLGAHLRQDKG